MTDTIKIGDKTVGGDAPVYVIAEIGINHNGSVDVAKKLVDAAVFAGANAVKFQKRTPEICVPKDQWDVMRDTPQWGRISYIEYRHNMEFTADQYGMIDAYCKERDMHWFASCWDEPSVEFITQFDVPAMKVASASLTDDGLLHAKRDTGLPVILSTGMSTMDQIDHAVAQLAADKTLLTHATSTYPCPPEELNLAMLHTLRDRFDVPVGYSGHETGLSTSVVAVALGASLVERHITLDRAMWGSDQAASIEPMGFFRLVRDIRNARTAIGDGVKKVYDSEQGPMKKLRRI